MKARLKGSNDAFKEVSHLSLKDSSFTYCADAFEFEQEQEPIDHWQDVRERAAIAAMHAFYVSPSSGAKNITLDKMAQHVVKVADALVEKLKED